MKIIYKICFAAFTILICLLLSSIAKAQSDHKTSESIGKQLKQNSVPGLKYGAQSSQKREREPVADNKQFKGDIREVIFKAGVPINNAQTSRINTSAAKLKASSLPSDSKTPEKTETKTEKTNTIPTQGNVKESATGSGKQ
nr:hypothetical protein [Pedobacter panaciterrae]